MEEPVCVHFSFVWFVYVAVCPPPGPTQTIYISYAYGTIYIFGESAIKHQANKQIVKRFPCVNEVYTHSCINPQIQKSVGFRRYILAVHTNFEQKFVLFAEHQYLQTVNDVNVVAAI